MTRVRSQIIRLGVATLAAACSTIIMLALFNWAMTERFYLHPSWRESLLVSVFALVCCAVGSLVLLPMLSLVKRFRPASRWFAAGLGGLLFWLAPSALLLKPAAGLLTLPAGIIAGLVLQSAGADTRPVGRPGFIALSCGLLLWLVLLAMPASQAWNEKELALQTPNNSLLGEHVTGGASFGSELWLFNQNGKAVSFHVADWQPSLRIRSGVVALATSGPTLWALLAPPFDWRSEHQPAARFRLASYAGGRWLYSPWQNYALDERPVALAFSPQGAIVLAPKRLYLMQRGLNAATIRALSQPIEPSGQFVTAVVGSDTMYVGANRGEWGGGLLRINLATGNVSVVQRREGKGFCSGPLNSDCDPVTGLVPDAKKPGCVFASIGLAHMIWHGRVLRVCGDHVETVFEAQILPIGQRIERVLSSRAREFPPQTEPVFALAPASGGFWAVTPRALYRWNQGKIDRQSFPSLKVVHGLAISDAIPGILVATTDVNAAVSLSGVTPLIFAKGGIKGANR